MLAAVPGAMWTEVLPEVLAGLRFLPGRLGFQPFLAVYKQFPRCLMEAYDAPVESPPLDLEEDDEAAQERFLVASSKWWDAAVVELRARLLSRD